MNRWLNKSLPTTECQLINEEILELESHHLSTIISIQAKIKWVLKLKGKNLKKINIYMVSTYISTRFLTTKKNSNFTVEKPDRHHLNEVKKLILSVMGQNYFISMLWYTEKDVTTHMKYYWQKCIMWIKSSGNIRKV